YNVLLSGAPSTTNNLASLRSIDRNGNVTTYDYPDESTINITDSQGRKTTLSFSPAQGGSAFYTYHINDTIVYGPGGSARLSSVTYPGPNGVPLTYTLTWIAKPINFSTSFGEISCYGKCGGGLTPPDQCVVPCSTTEVVDLVSSIQIPDGRLYQF